MNNGLSEKHGEVPASFNSLSMSHNTESEEESILRKKVQIKTQALLMLSQELDQCRMQRDRYKLMSEQLQEDLARWKQLDQTDLDKKTINGYKSATDPDCFSKNSDRLTTLEEGTKLMDLLIETQEQNKCLRLQVDTMRQKLKEAQEDIKALRSKKIQNLKLNDTTVALHQREEMIEQLEKLNVKCRQLKLDLKSVLDEKQEIEMERDAFKCKAHRLNHELSQALSASKPVDIDALVNENRYLQERLQQLLEEKDLTQQSVQKYKSMLDSKRQKGTIKLGVKSSVGSVMTFKQVEQLLQQDPKNIPPQKAADALFELHSICTGLLEALNDKNLALIHQKKTNKILAARMCELDKNIQSPTLKLLEGYSNADVDVKFDATSMTSDLSEERSESKESDLQNDVSFTESNTKSKESEENIAEQGVESREYDKCCGEKKIDTENPDESLSEEDEEDRLKSIKYPDGSMSLSNLPFDEINFKESFKTRLPEKLIPIVQKYLDELEAKDQKDS
ncbi:coiled-coil domain-containing protein 149 [Copidosoma floridanum]|uniref:coiled-coil domain-containing protein 149 n=1 Tax=Copidosoma floridanum TaxID=29053 RepID=UPI0006C9CEE0|nr:coiled-coil domain-containing protein 149 [Copidosoma floridanum]XP_014216463.1 coiled-coil domain-containing protein 149 [Copidosoma floridanum]